MPFPPLSKLWQDITARLCMASPEDDLSNTTVYFGYGSNLWKHQMTQRCPTSKYLGIARLKGYRWLIYERGYANIIEIPESEDNAERHAYKDEVWGLVYSLEPSDEQRLDRNEGVPFAYTKEHIEIEFWPSSSRNTTTIDTRKKGKQVDMLVYINRKLVTPSKPKKEYIYRMNMGIKDAIDEGVPKEYMKQVLRCYIPDEEDEKVVELARKQALVFEDEA